MKEYGFLINFSKNIEKELISIKKSLKLDAYTKDLSHLLWCSIDNNDSLDIDQLTVAEIIDTNIRKFFVAISDVASLVKINKPIDNYARQNTTSVYTDAEIFPMLPPELSTNLSSLNLNENRAAFVVEINIDAEGKILKTSIYKALVYNHAKLSYDSVASWLDGKSLAPEELQKVKDLDTNIKLQDEIAQDLRKQRYESGALNFETIHTRSVFINNLVKDLETDRKNRAKQIIEEFMIASNEAIVKYLKSKKLPFFRRVVKTPKNWERIVDIVANNYNYKLPVKPDAKELSIFLFNQKQIDPISFPDLSLTIIKLIGKGEYIVEFEGQEAVGHFGLAIKDYTHATAPNRRYPDLITQRILNAALEGIKSPYTKEALINLASLCTRKEDDATKVERRVVKSAGALLLSSKIGEEFNAICTGSSSKGVWVRLFNPPIEGRLIRVSKRIDVGMKIRVKLIRTEAKKGFIDFALIDT